MKKIFDINFIITLILGIVVIGTVVTIFFVLLSTITTAGPSFIFSVINTIVIIVAVVIAYLTLSYNKSRNQSADFLTKSLSLLEKAHDLFNDRDENDFPKNDRLLWLSVARLIKTSQDTSELITEPSHKRIYNIELSYWRYKFSEILTVGDKHHTFPEEYFAEKPIDHHFKLGEGRSPLSLISLAFMYKFVKWPEGELDPLDGVEPFTEQEINKMITFGPEELGRHLLKTLTAIEDEKKTRKIE